MSSFGLASPLTKVLLGCVQTVELPQNTMLSAPSGHLIILNQTKKQNTQTETQKNRVKEAKGEMVVNHLLKQAAESVCGALPETGPGGGADVSVRGRASGI